MHVVATAGHVDHGKSTLVRALTGQDPDRLEEERRRGLSIQLGYCWTSLPPVGDVAFVDVPGHERFLTTTLAGLGPVPVAVLVVAADDPWMPQAAEHLAALDALQVRHGVVAVTRSDLADPRPALARAGAEVARTSLAGAPLVAVSGRTGAGLDRLRAELVALLGQVPSPDPAAPVRLWVDRAFHAHGTGTVVTGTLPAGTVRVGDLLDSEHGQVRVRDIRSLGREVPAATGVARVALALTGRPASRVGRGEVLTTPAAHEPTREVDVRLAHDEAIPERPLLHAGAASQAVHARPLGGALVRLRLERPLPLRLGDRVLLRDPGNRRLVGAVVLDPAPPPLRRRGAAAARAEDLAGSDAELASVGGQVRLRGVAERSLLLRLGATGDVPPEVVCAGDWLVAPERALELATQVSAYAAGRSTSTRPGIPLHEAARAVGLPDEAIVTAVLTWSGGATGPGSVWRVRRGHVEPVPVATGADAPAGPDRAAGPAGTGDTGGSETHHRRRDHARGAAAQPTEDVAAGDRRPVPPHLAEALTAVREDLRRDPFRAPDARRLVELGLDRHALGALTAAGHLLRVGEGLVLLPGADERAVQLLGELEQPFTASQARSALGTSRRVVLPLLDHLDRTRRTVRLPDDRRRVRG